MSGHEKYKNAFDEILRTVGDDRAPKEEPVAVKPAMVVIDTINKIADSVKAGGVEKAKEIERVNGLIPLADVRCGYQRNDALDEENGVSGIEKCASRFETVKKFSGDPFIPAFMRYIETWGKTSDGIILGDCVRLAICEEIGSKYAIYRQQPDTCKIIAWEPAAGLKFHSHDHARQWLFTNGYAHIFGKDEDVVERIPYATGGEIPTDRKPAAPVFGKLVIGEHAIPYGWSRNQFMSRGMYPDKITINYSDIRPDGPKISDKLRAIVEEKVGVTKAKSEIWKNGTGLTELSVELRFVKSLNGWRIFQMIDGHGCQWHEARDLIFPTEQEARDQATRCGYQQDTNLSPSKCDYFEVTNSLSARNVGKTAIQQAFLQSIDESARKIGESKYGALNWSWPRVEGRVECQFNDSALHSWMTRTDADMVKFEGDYIDRDDERWDDRADVFITVNGKRFSEADMPTMFKAVNIKDGWADTVITLDNGDDEVELPGGRIYGAFEVFFWKDEAPAWKGSVPRTPIGKED